MKIRRSILLLTATVAVLFVAFILSSRRRQAGKSTRTLGESHVVSLETTESRSLALSVVNPTNVPALGAAGTPAPKRTAATKDENIRGILSTYNDVPIDFYGKLEDQFENPVAGAEIKASIRVISGERQGTDRLTTTSDTNGLFEFHGRGQDIGMVPSKSGYALASTGTQFKYSRLEETPFSSDPNNPTVIKLWRLQGAEPLLSISQQHKLPYTQAPISFDLLAGKTVPEGGDIKVTVNRPAGVISGRNRQDWSLKVEAVNGGLLDAGEQEAVTYAAPESGYHPQETLLMSAASNTWYESVQRGFFIRARNGRVFGKLGMSFRINSDPDGMMNVRFSGVVNTNGSRNLEGDPETMNTLAR
jgi:hypothetical protein